MTKQTTKAAKSNLIVSTGEGWRIEFDRVSKDYAAIIDGVGHIGSANRPSDAQTLINEYRFQQLRRAAA